MLRRLSATAGLAAVAALSEPTFAADHLNLEPGLPVTIEDAYPIAYRGREVQGRFAYERTDNDDNLFELEPRLQIGPLPNLELGLQVPYRLGDTEDSDSGEAVLDGLYNFNTEGLYLPALALAGGVSAPFGEDDLHVESEVTFIATKTLTGFVPRRLHLNLSWLHAFSADADERDDRYRAGIGYSQPVQTDLLFVADLVREQQVTDDEDQNLVEAGVRWQFNPLTVLTAGGGVGLGEESPDFRVVVGFQYSLTRPEFYR